MNRGDEQTGDGMGPGPGVSGSGGPGGRLARLAGLVLLGLVAVLGVLIVPSWLWLIPAPLRARPELTLLGLVILIETAVQGLGRHVPGQVRGRGGLELLARVHEQVAGGVEWLLGWPLVVGIGLTLVAWIASWAPHYLTWPFWTDWNHFIDMARNWDRGILPYRDHRAYNLPGQVYAAWVVGKVLGWENMRWIHALDVMLVAAVAAGMAGASRAWVGSRLAGWTAGLGLIWFALGANYAMSGQRDEQASLWVALGWLALWWRTRWAGVVVSVWGFAAAATLRPQVVLFVPGLLLASYHAPGVDGASRGWRSLGVWVGGAAVGVVVAYAPLWSQGLLDDLLAGLRMSGHGGVLSRWTWSDFAERLRGNLAWPLTVPSWVGLVLAAWRGPAVVRRACWSALVLFWGALLYRPISPRDHFYLEHPLVIVAMVGVLVVLSAWLGMRGAPALARFAGWLMVICVISPSVPRYCNAARSVSAVGDLAVGRIPAEVPPGAADFFRHGEKVTGSYEWNDIKAVVDYLRGATRPDTDVVNLLRQAPFPTLTGMAGRPSPFRCEGGLFWVSWGPPEPEDHFLEDLARASADCVVVWVPDEAAADPGMALPRVTAHLRAHYAVERRFGPLEIWRRQPMGTGGVIPGRG